MASSRVSASRHLLHRILQLCLLRVTIEAYEPSISLYRTISAWIDSAQASTSAFWDDHLSPAPDLIQSKICFVAIKEVFQPLGFQPKDGSCERISIGMLWVTKIFLGGCLLRYLCLLPLWEALRKEGAEFWRALLSDGA